MWPLMIFGLGAYAFYSWHKKHAAPALPMPTGMPQAMAAPEASPVDAPPSDPASDDGGGGGGGGGGGSSDGYPMDPAPTSGGAAVAPGTGPGSLTAQPLTAAALSFAPRPTTVAPIGTRGTRVPHAPAPALILPDLKTTAPTAPQPTLTSQPFATAFAPRPTAPTGAPIPIAPPTGKTFSR